MCVDFYGLRFLAGNRMVNAMKSFFEKEQTKHTKNKYRKISKIGPLGSYFSKALFEGLIFAGAYTRRGLSMERNLRFKIDWANLKVGGKFTVFALFCFVFEGNFLVQAPGGLIFGGAI